MFGGRILSQQPLAEQTVNKGSVLGFVLGRTRIKKGPSGCFWFQKSLRSDGGVFCVCPVLTTLQILSSYWSCLLFSWSLTFYWFSDVRWWWSGSDPCLDSYTCWPWITGAFSPASPLLFPPVCLGADKNGVESINEKIIIIHSFTASKPWCLSRFIVSIVVHQCQFSIRIL